MGKIGEINFEQEVYKYLKSLYGSNADFRDGQLEAIVSVLNKGYVR